MGRSDEIPLCPSPGDCSIAADPLHAVAHLRLPLPLAGREIEGAWFSESIGVIPHEVETAGSFGHLCSVPCAVPSWPRRLTDIEWY